MPRLSGRPESGESREWGERVLLPLTVRQRAIYDLVVRWWSEGRVPLVKSLAKSLGVNDLAVRQHVRALARKGWVEWSRDQSGTAPIWPAGMRARLALLVDREFAEVLP